MSDFLQESCPMAIDRDRTKHNNYYCAQIMQWLAQSIENDSWERSTVPTTEVVAGDTKSAYAD